MKDICRVKDAARPGEAVPVPGYIDGRPTRRRHARRSRYVAALVAGLVVLVPMPAVVADDTPAAGSSTTDLNLRPVVGATTGGEPVEIEGLSLSTSLFAQIEAGNGTTLALTQDGRLYAWGYAGWGQLGNGTQDTATVAVPVDMTGALAGKVVTQIAAGSANCLVLTADGELVGWGSNLYGQLGPHPADGNVVTRPRTIDTSGLRLAAGETITKIDASDFRTTVLTSRGRLFAWGGNSHGQLGNATTTDSDTPVSPNPGAMGAAAVISDFAVGGDTTYALAGGKVYAWGSNSIGQLGNGSSGSDYSVPIAVDTSGVLSGRTVTRIEAGSSFAVVMTTQGALYAWGANSYGQLGNGTKDYSSVPVAVDLAGGSLSGQIVDSIEVGFFQVFAMDKQGGVHGWGFNIDGQLGTGSSGTGESLPVKMDLSPFEGRTVLKVSSGYRHSLAIDAAGRLFGWGSASDGRLGVGETTNVMRPIPTLVLTHGVYFQSADERKPASEVSVNLVAGTIEALTPPFTAGEAEVYVEPVFVPDAP